MKMHLFKITGVILISIIASCTNVQTKRSSYIVDVDLGNAISLKEEASSIEAMCLNDSLSEHFPGDMTKVKWTGNSILVLDSWKDPGLYQYDSEGLLINSFTNRGNGPGEFVRVVDFNVTSSGIILLDTYSESQRLFLDKNLSFLYKKDAEKQSSHFFQEESKDGGVWYDRGNVAYGENKNKLVYEKDEKKKTVLSVPGEIENVTFASYNAFAGIANDTVLYLPAVEPRIYKCYDGKAEVFCDLNFGDLWPDFSGVDKSNPLELMRRIVDEGKIYSTNIVSDGNDFAISFFCKEKCYIMLFRYPEKEPYKLLYADKNIIESIGNLVCMKDGCLVFGKPGKLLKFGIKMK
ncbi:6-bladed beta-propeller [uncultured Bacteroides sp.]|uniref:6-bladed beta-propeller n=1 Tax=uncultured Bacteroides sp. TaxID=162156 RepID=UPI002631230A|nr:6-bladed beta-propeller [uncultured Bacteroides sp.]